MIQRAISANPLSRQRSPLDQGLEFALCHLARHWGEPAIRTSDQMLMGYELKRPSDRVSNFLRGFDRIARHVDHADHDVFASEQRYQIGRDA
jgi:hypothetical protein